MACPKVRTVYPNTARLIERPISALIRKIDPGFDKAHRFDVAYEFPLRVFIEDSLIHGAYNGDSHIGFYLTTESGQIITGENGQPIIDGSSLAAIDAEFKAANGFCDPVDDGTVYTGTGAGGANPGSVPSIGAGAGAEFDGGAPPHNRLLGQEDGTFIKTEDGRYIRIS